MRFSPGVAAAAALIVVGCGGAPSDQSAGVGVGVGAGAASPRTDSAGGVAASGDFAVEIVAVDPIAKTVTLRAPAAGGTTTVAVGSSAVGSLRDYKAGDRVVVSCTVGGSGTGTLSSCTSVRTIRKAG